MIAHSQRAPLASLLGAVLVSALGFVGCGSSHRNPTSPSSTRGYLLIIGEGETVHTEWVGADGTPRGRADGAFLGTADRLYRFESHAERVTLDGCGEILTDPETGEPRDPMGSVAGARLSGLGGRESLVLVGPAADIHEYAHYTESHAVIAALGDRVVIASRREREACGAHGDLEVTVRTFDLSGRELSASPEERAARALQAPAALAAMRALEPDREADCLGPDAAPSYRTSVVGFAGEGIIARHLFAASTPYACGALSAPSSSYEWALWLEGPESELPAYFDERDVPAAVRSLASAHHAIGVSWLDVDRAPMSDAFALSSPSDPHP